jgi:hypothetical protein
MPLQHFQIQLLYTDSRCKGDSDDGHATATAFSLAITTFGILLTRSISARFRDLGSDLSNDCMIE